MERWGENVHTEDPVCAKPRSADGFAGIKRFGIKEAWLRLLALVLFSQLCNFSEVACLLCASVASAEI